MQYTLYTKIDGTVSDIQIINSEFPKFKLPPPKPQFFSAIYGSLDNYWLFENLLGLMETQPSWEYPSEAVPSINYIGRQLDVAYIGRQVNGEISIYR